MTEIAETVGDGLSRDAGELQEEKSPHDSRSRVVIFLPALNEEGGIGHVMDRIPRAELEAAGHSVSVWIVDGNSTDRTLEVGRARGAKVFVQDGRGKGNGMRQAFHQRLHRRDYTDGGSFDREFYMMLDADGTYPPEAIPEFVESLASGNDVVLGSRFRGRMEEGAMSPLNAMGNRMLSKLAQVLYGVPVTDVCTGMWGFTPEALRRIPLEATGFDLEADLFGSACLSQARIHELPVDYAARIGSAKLSPLRTGWQIARRLLTRRLSGRYSEGGPRASGSIPELGRAAASR
jgi:dolichol-phosphate mannosyltransferase